MYLKFTFSFYCVTLFFNNKLNYGTQMANVNQFIDHVNRKMKSLYKDGIWIKGYVTKMALEVDNTIMVEIVDIRKYDNEMPDSKIVLRILEKDHQDLIYHFSKYLDELFEFRTVTVEGGSLALYFKVEPSVHWLGEFFPVVREIGLDQEAAQKENVSKGLNVGIDKAILSLPDSHRSPWDDAQNDRLKEYYLNRGFSIEALAVAMKRTPLAVVDQLIKIKVIQGTKAYRLRNTVMKNFG